MARMAAASASGAEPISRCRGMPGFAGQRPHQRRPGRRRRTPWRRAECRAQAAPRFPDRRPGCHSDAAGPARSATTHTSQPTARARIRGALEPGGERADRAGLLDVERLARRHLASGSMSTTRDTAPRVASAWAVAPPSSPSAEDGDRAHVVKYCNEPTTSSPGFRLPASGSTNDERLTTNEHDTLRKGGGRHRRLARHRTGGRRVCCDGKARRLRSSAPTPPTCAPPWRR